MIVTEAEVEVSSWFGDEQAERLMTGDFAFASGRNIWMPAGTYVTSATLTLSTNSQTIAGDGMSTRIAINPRPYGMHNFDPESGARQ